MIMVDLERGVAPARPQSPVPSILVSQASDHEQNAMPKNLRNLQEDLKLYLDDHLNDVKALKETLAKQELAAPIPVRSHINVDQPNSAVPHTLQGRKSLEVSSHVDGGIPSVSRRPSVNSVYAPVDEYTHQLVKFLHEHMQNLRKFHEALESRPPRSRASSFMGPPGARPPPPPSSHHTEKDAKMFESLTSQFNMLVVISTFTASLIVSFVALAFSLIKPDRRVWFDVGMVMSFFALGIHFGNIIVAGRGAALSSQHGANEVAYDVKYFRLYLGICEQLQLFATIIFIASIVVHSFFMFDHYAYPITLVSASVVWAVFIFWIAYWKVSITWRNIKFIMKRLRRWTRYDQR